VGFGLQVHSGSRSTFGADSDQQYRGVVRVVTGFSSLLLLAVAASGCSSTPSSAPAPRSPTTTELSSTTTTLYSIERCGGITSSSDLHPNVDNRKLLLTQADGLPDYTYGAAQMASGRTVTASVPSYSPAVYESFQVPPSDGGWGGQEVIGEVGSSNAASQLAQQVESNIVSCEGGEQVTLPTSVPGVTAETYQYALSRFNGWVRNAIATVAKGSYIVSFQWSNSNTCSTYGGTPCPPAPTSPPPMPSASDMADLVNAALAKIG
jgi:hypothetical protein